MIHQTLNHIAILLVLVTFVGAFAKLLKQPLIVALLIVGFLSGPSGFCLVTKNDFMTTTSEIAVSLLLFLVGLKLSPSLIRQLGKVSLATGLGQILFTSFFGCLIGLATGIDFVSSLYVAIALTFSSTIIIVKLLTDKQELESLHGRIAVGFLIVQDLFVILCLVGLSVIFPGEGVSKVHPTSSLLVGTIFFILISPWARNFLNFMSQWLASQADLLIISSISWAIGIAELSGFFGLGKELGGLVAGLSLSGVQVKETINAKLSPIRDFLLIFFFVTLGLDVDSRLLGADLYRSIIFSIFVLVGNPLIVLGIMGFLGFRKRTSFLAGLTVAQISEFSLIFTAYGVRVGHIGVEALGLVTMVGVLTIIGSVYAILWSHKLFDFFEPWLGIFERKNTIQEIGFLNESDREQTTIHGDIIILGLGRYGSKIGEELGRRGCKVFGVDFSPDRAHEWRKKGYHGITLDLTDQTVVEGIPWNQFQVIVWAIPQPAGLPLSDPMPFQVFWEHLSQVGFKGILVVRQDHFESLGKSLQTNNQDKQMFKMIVLHPLQDAAAYASEFIFSQVKNHSKLCDVSDKRV